MTGSAVACKRPPSPFEQNWGERRLSPRFCLRGGGGCTQTSVRTFLSNFVPNLSLTCLFGTWREHTQKSVALHHQSLACHSLITRVLRSPLCKRRQQSIYSVRVHCTPESLIFFFTYICDYVRSIHLTTYLTFHNH